MFLTAKPRKTDKYEYVHSPWPLPCLISSFHWTLDTIDKWAFLRYIHLHSFLPPPIHTHHGSHNVIISFVTAISSLTLCRLKGWKENNKARRVWQTHTKWIVWQENCPESKKRETFDRRCDPLCHQDCWHDWDQVSLISSKINHLFYS